MKKEKTTILSRLSAGLGLQATSRRIVIVAAMAIIAITSAKAQRIEVVDTEGHAIPLASVLTNDGTLLGTTDMNGILADVKGAKEVAVTHVAYKPQQVNVASLPGGRITMESLDYSIAEIVVKPKPYIYVQTYYRFYAFINDSLRFYQAGIMPNAYNVQKKKVEMGSHSNSYGDFYPSMGVGITWGARVMEFHAGKIHKSSAKFLNDSVQYYFTTLTDEGNGRRRVDNPEGTMGYIVNEGGMISTTLDAGKLQMYRNKALGEDKKLKKREEMEYAYQYTDVFMVDENGNCGIEDMVMDTNHWEWTKSKGRYKMIIETYTVDRGYMDKAEWKAKKKELKQEYKSVLSLNQLETYATKHNIPALAPSIRQTIERLGKK